MRTVFWCACALAVTAASLAYLAADYAYRYPESKVGRCTLVGYRIATDCNPVVRFGQVMSQCAAEATREVMTVAACKGAKACCAPSACQTSNPEDGSTQPDGGERPVDIIDLANYQIPIPQADDPTAEVITNVQETHTGSLMIGIGVNSDAGLTGVVVQPESPCTPRCMNPETEVPATVPTEKKDEITSDSEDSELQDWLRQYEESAVDPKPQTEKVQPQGDQEESEAINEGEPPTCQEDPSSAHQYPSCPYMGGCPSSGHCPVQMDPAPVTPKKTKKRKSKKEEPKPEPTKSAVPAKPVVPEAESGNEEQEPQSEIDTMEFRKSDAQKDEFKPGPF